MIDCLTYKTEAEAQAAVDALKSVGLKAQWFLSTVLGCYVVPLR